MPSKYSQTTKNKSLHPFKPADDNEPHIALANIRQRLSLMCNGRLDIRERPGGGTIVTVTIP